MSRPPKCPFLARIGVVRPISPEGAPERELSCLWLLLTVSNKVLWDTLPTEQLPVCASLLTVCRALVSESTRVRTVLARASFSHHLDFVVSSRADLCGSQPTSLLFNDPRRSPHPTGSLIGSWPPEAYRHRPANMPVVSPKEQGQYAAQRGMPTRRLLRQNADMTDSLGPDSGSSTMRTTRIMPSPRRE